MTRRRGVTIGVLLAAAMAVAAPASAQDTLSGVLSFLLINRSVQTGDFTRDEQAAAATRDAIISFLQTELATLPVTSPASGFTYRLDPSLGAAVRSSDSFGPFFTERSLSAGRQQYSFGLAFSQASFETMDGRNLRDGTLVATASRLTGETQPFDAETLTVRMNSRVVTLTAHAGVTDRLDVGAALPLVSVNFSGERVDTYRGSAAVQATASASAIGVGDVVLRAKYNVWRRGASGIAAGAEARLATGDRENLIGGGENLFTPRAMVSYERGWLELDGNFGYTIGQTIRAVEYSGAVSAVASPRITFVGEIVGRRVNHSHQLTEIVEPRLDLTGVETIRLVALPATTNHAIVVGGVRWNVAGQWLVGAYVLRPITTAGLNARWVTSINVDYAFGG
ncbi:MAG TPA: transporter [Vicinamibacterales bacterium]|nr:transporter [Vicinamibacterales bacterium]